MITLSDVQLNGVLAPVAWGYNPGNFMARDILPVVKVDGPSGKYPVFTADELRYDTSVHAGMSASVGVDYGVSFSNYDCEPHSRHFLLPDAVVRDKNIERVLGLATAGLKKVTTKHRIEEEYALAAAMQTSGNFTVTNYVTPTNKWNASNGDPVANINTGIAKIESYSDGQPANMVIAMYVTPDVDRALRDYIRATLAAPTVQAGNITPEQVALFFGVAKYRVLSAKYNASAKNVAASMTNIWGTGNCWLIYQAPDPNEMSPSFGYTFVDTTSTEVDQEVLKDPKALKIIAHEWYDQVPVSYNVAYWLYTCLQ